MQGCKEAGQRGRVPPSFPLPCHLFNSVVITGKVPLNQILCRVAGGRKETYSAFTCTIPENDLGSHSSCLHHINTNKIPRQLPVPKCQHLLTPETSTNFNAAAF